MERLSFRDILQKDLKNTFFNPQEFAENTHTIDGKKMTVIFDELEQIEREKKMKSNMDGVRVREILIYVQSSEFGPLPAYDRLIRLDGVTYRIKDAVAEGGVYSLTLEANRSR